VAEVEEKERRFKLPGTGWRRSLLAVLIGNVIYFGSYDYLPEWAQHKPYVYDVGLAIDFWICVLVYILIRLLFPRL
jgi:hypothetical protein